jgi:hypothetical protein
MSNFCCYAITAILVACLSFPAPQARVTPIGSGKAVIATLDVCHLPGPSGTNSEMPSVSESVFESFYEKTKEVFSADQYVRKDSIFTKKDYKPPKIFLS